MNSEADSENMSVIQDFLMTTIHTSDCCREVATNSLIRLNGLYINNYTGMDTNCLYNQLLAGYL